MKKTFLILFLLCGFKADAQICDFAEFPSWRELIINQIFLKEQYKIESEYYKKNKIKSILYKEEKDFRMGYEMQLDREGRMTEHSHHFKSGEPMGRETLEYNAEGNVSKIVYYYKGSYDFALNFKYTEGRLTNMKSEGRELSADDAEISYRTNGKIKNIYLTKKGEEVASYDFAYEDTKINVLKNLDSVKVEISHDGKIFVVADADRYSNVYIRKEKLAAIKMVFSTKTALRKYNEVMGKVLTDEKSSLADKITAFIMDLDADVYMYDFDERGMPVFYSKINKDESLTFEPEFEFYD